MKKGFNHKDLSLIAGIAVALIIVFTVWVRQNPQRPAQNLIHKTKFSIPDLSASLIDRTFAEVAR